MASRKKLLVIGAGDFQLALVKRAAMMCDVLLAAPVIDKPFERYIADALYCDVRDFARILEFARGANCFGTPIDGVITDETDIPVLTVARVAEAMGLSGIDPDTARLFTNKALMRKRMEELGLKVLPHKTVSSLEEAVAAFKEINSTVIIKPLDAQGSRGVKRCDNAQDIVEHFAEAARWSTTHQVMVEQRATGREFVIEGLALNYEFKNLGIGDTIYFETVESLSAKERTWPTVVDDELRDRVLELNTKIVTGFGLKQGITHSEFVMDGDDIFLIETAARGGGAFISSDLIPASCGLVSEDLLVRMALGEVQTYDAIIDSKGEPLFETGNVTVGSIMDVVNEQRSCRLMIRDRLPEALREMGRAAVRAFDVKKRMVHFEFFELSRDQRIGKAGEYAGLEVNMRPCGGILPTMLNYAADTDVYQIWADMIVFDRSIKSCGAGRFCVLAGRRNARHYVMSREEVLRVYGGSILGEIEEDPATATDMGDHLFLARFSTMEEVTDFFALVLAEC